MAETQVDEILLLGIKVELFSMEDCWHQPRGKRVLQATIGKGGIYE